MNESISLGNQALAVHLIHRAIWAVVGFSTFMAGVVTWAIMVLRRRITRQRSSTSLVNSLAVIAVLLTSCGSSYLLFVAAEPSAFLQSVMGLYCFPPTALQLSAPFGASLLATILHAIVWPGRGGAT